MAKGRFTRINLAGCVLVAYHLAKLTGNIVKVARAIFTLALSKSLALSWLSRLEYRDATALHYRNSASMVVL